MAETNALLKRHTGNCIESSNLSVSASYPAAGVKLTDSNRLFLLVTPSGGKLWRWNYSYDGKQKSMSFGIYPMAALAAARAERDETRAVLAEGRDPSVVKKLKIEANIEASRNTFERIAREWHATSRPQWAAVQADDVIRSLDRDVFPAIGSLPVADLKPPKISEVLKDIEDRGSIETAKRVRQRISDVFIYAIAKGHRWIEKKSSTATISCLSHRRAPLCCARYGRLLNRAGYHGHHVPHGFLAAFPTIMNEWAERNGKTHDRKVIDFMLAHVPKGKVEGAYNRSAYMSRRRELARVL